MKRTLLSITALLLASAAGCGGAPARPTGRTGPLRARELYPMGEGYIWTHDVDTQTGISTLSITRVTEAAPPRFVIQADGARDRHVYEIREEGIWDVDQDAWLIRDPLVLGETWSAGPSRTARITGVAQAVDVPAGHFEDCVEVTVENEQTQGRSRTVYCPEQGPAIVEYHQELMTTGGITIHGELRAPVQRGMEDVEEPEGYDDAPGE